MRSMIGDAVVDTWYRDVANDNDGSGSDRVDRLPLVDVAKDRVARDRRSRFDGHVHMHVASI